MLRISPDGKAFAVHDASLREIHALTPAPDGSIYALALGEAASTTKTTAATSTDAATVTATVTSTVTAADETGATQPASTRSRSDLSNARSAVLHIMPDGGADVVWSSTSVTGFSILAIKGGS